MSKSNLKLVGVALCSMWLICCATVVADHMHSEWIHNGTGEDATNLEKWLKGDVKIIDWYQGSLFPSFSYGYSPSENHTKLRWYETTLPDSMWAYACYRTKQATIEYKYLPRWTFPDADSVVAGPALSAGVTPWEEFYVSNTPLERVDITIGLIQVATINTRLTLDELLYDSLDWVPWSDSMIMVPLAPDDSIYFFGLVSNIPSGGALVYRATVWLDSDPNNVVYYAGQYWVPPIPTLTEWGMIIFCVLLFGWMAWVIVRRRKRVTAGI